jgi:hypothetical protein
VCIEKNAVLFLWYLPGGFLVTGEIENTEVLQRYLLCLGVLLLLTIPTPEPSSLPLTIFTSEPSCYP